jgi:hypothetical protein
MAKSQMSRHPMDSYIQQRIAGGNYQFRRAVPEGLREAIGKREIFKSLKTREHLIALRRAQTEFDESERLFATAKSGDLINLDVDFTDVDEIDRVLAKLAATRAALAEELSVQTTDETSLIVEYQNVRAKGFADSEGRNINSNIHIPKGSALDSAWQKNRETAVLTTLAGLIKDKRQHELDVLDTEDLTAFERQMFKDNGKREKPMPTVWAIYAEFKQHRMIENTDEEKARFEHIVKNFMSFVGDSTPMNYVTRKQVIEFFRLLANFPPRLNAEQRTLSFMEITAGHHKKTISKTTSKEWFRRLNRLFAYGVNAYGDAFKVANPFVGMEDEPKGREPIKKRPWEPEEVSALFTQPEFRCRDSFFWSLVCAVHHGNRLSEFHARKITDLQKDKNGIWFIDVREGKNDEYSVRHVPLHQWIIDQGFLDFVEQSRRSGSEYLFPDENHDDPDSDAFSKKFRRYLVSRKLYDESRTLHNLRNTFVTNAHRSGIEGVSDVVLTVMRIVGHAPETEHKKRYWSIYLDTMKMALDQVRIEGFPYEMFEQA